jgi:hypothetical protein
VQSWIQETVSGCVFAAILWKPIVFYAIYPMLGFLNYQKMVILKGETFRKNGGNDSKE